MSTKEAKQMDQALFDFMAGLRLVRHCRLQFSMC